MLALKPGVSLDCSPGVAHLLYITSAAKREIPAELVGEAEKLALGEVPSLDHLSDELRTITDGWVSEAEDILDPLFELALKKIDNRFAWAQGTTDSHYPLVLGVHARRRRLLRSLGQYPALPETVCRRLRLAPREPSDILVLGDDDLLSLGLSAAGHRVVSVDADPFLIPFVQRQAERLELSLDARRWDFRQPMPEDLVGRFDCVFSDPMSSVACLGLFVDRALAALKEGGRLWVAVNDPAAKIFDVHRRETRVALLDHFSDFNHYYTGFLTLSPYVSDLYGLHKTEVTRPTLAPEEGFYGSGLYDEEHYGVRTSSRFVIKHIDPSLTELIHIKSMVEEVKRLGEIHFDDELYHWDESYRAFVALLEKGHVVVIAVHLESQLAEMLTSPPNDEVESIFQAAMMALYHKEGSYSVSRMRTPLGAHLP